MKKSQLEHVLRAAKEICHDEEFFIIGSQSLHGKYPDLPDEIMISVEVDLIAKNKPEKTDNLNSIGIESPFHEMYGYYADPVDFKTATLPRDWKNRLVNLKTTSLSNGAKAYCLEPHDLAIAKLSAWREKDKIFVKFLAENDIISREKIDMLIDRVPIKAEEKEILKKRLDLAFNIKKKKPFSP